MIMKKFSEPFGLETNSTLQDGSKSESSDQRKGVLNFKGMIE